MEEKSSGRLFLVPVDATEVRTCQLAVQCVPFKSLVNSVNAMLTGLSTQLGLGTGKPLQKRCKAFLPCPEYPSCTQQPREAASEHDPDKEKRNL